MVMASFSENAWDALNPHSQFVEGNWLGLRPRWESYRMGVRQRTGSQLAHASSTGIVFTSAGEPPGGQALIFKSLSCNAGEAGVSPNTSSCIRQIVLETSSFLLACAAFRSVLST
jgi:hypothetical protein